MGGLPARDEGSRRQSVLIMPDPGSCPGQAVRRHPVQRRRRAAPSLAFFRRLWPDCGAGLVVSRGGVAGDGVRLQRAVGGLGAHALEPRRPLGPLPCVVLRTRFAQIERPPYPTCSH